MAARVSSIPRRREAQPWKAARLVARRECSWEARLFLVRPADRRRLPLEVLSDREEVLRRREGAQRRDDVRVAVVPEERELEGVEQRFQVNRGKRGLEKRVERAGRPACAGDADNERWAGASSSAAGKGDALGERNMCARSAPGSPRRGRSWRSMRRCMVVKNCQLTPVF